MRPLFKKANAVLRCDNPFWKFSLAVYAQPGVAAECLALQSALGIDVNALLFCAWVGAEQKRLLNDAQFALIDKQVKRWHDNVVKPLRAVRQTMKPLPEMSDEAVQNLRKEVASAELRAEEIEQAMLFEAADAIIRDADAGGEDAIAANVVAFVRRHATGAEIPPPPRLLIAAAGAYRPTAGAKSP